MLKTINIFRFSVQCYGKCCGLINRVSTSAFLQRGGDVIENKKFKYLESEKKKFEDTFGDIEIFERNFERLQEDPEDIAEYERQKAAKGKTLAEYKEEIGNLLKNHNFKEALRVVEVDMVNDKIKYDIKVIGIFRMLFNYTGLKGDLEAAYKLYGRYRNRGGRMTGPMYTALFNACANCKNSSLALEKARILRENLSEDKLHKCNVFNYNSMLKAFGRHGDIPTCLKIFDEVLHKRLKAFTPTYNFLLQSCISDRNSGLRHALVIWRKMLQNRRKPDIFFFNLFLRCVRDCSLGDVELVPDLIKQLNEESGKFFKKKLIVKKQGNIIQKKIINVPVKGTEFLQFTEETTEKSSGKNENPSSSEVTDTVESSQNVEGELQASEMSGLEISVAGPETDEVKNEFSALELSINEENKKEDFNQSEENISVLSSGTEEMEPDDKEGCALPNLLAFVPSTGSVVQFGAMSEPHHRIMLFGGVDGFLKTMAKFKVEPNVLTLSLLLNVSPHTKEAEQEIIELAKLYKVELDPPFFSQLLKKRIFTGRSDLIKETLNEMQKANVQPDLICFGVLAFGCDTREMGMELLESLKVYGYRANSEILYGLLDRAGRSKDFVYVKAILDWAKADNVELNSKFIAKLGKIVRSEASERCQSSNEASRPVLDS